MAIFNYSQAFWERIAREEQARLQSYKLAWEYYEGRQPRSLKVKPQQPDDNVILNLYAYVIDKGVSFLFGKDLRMDLDANTKDETPAEKHLAAVWKANNKMAFLQDVALNGANCGHCFVEIVPQQDKPARLINLDPAIVRPHWDPDDIERRLWYKIEYEALNDEGKQVFRKRLIEWNKDTDTWLISRFEKLAGQPHYTQLAEVPWNYPFPPIVDWKNLPAPNVFFGRRDIEEVAAQNGVNFIASNMQKIIRYHAHPKTWAKGFTAAQGVTVGPDDMIIIPSENGNVGNLEMQSDLVATRAYFDTLVDLFLRLNHTANLDPAKVSVGALSGFALKILNWDALAVTDKKHLLYGWGIREINRRLLILGGLEEEETNLYWQSPLPENRKETADELKVEIEIGTVSKETAASDLGRDWNQEQERKQTEAQQNDSVGAELLRAFNAGKGTGTNEPPPGQ